MVVHSEVKAIFIGKSGAFQLCDWDLIPAI